MGQNSSDQKTRVQRRPRPQATGAITPVTTQNKRRAAGCGPIENRKTADFPVRKLEHSDSQRPGGTLPGQPSAAYLAKRQAWLERANEMVRQSLIEQSEYLDALDVEPDKPPVEILPNARGRYWMMGRSIGEPRVFTSPEQMRDAAASYFEWNMKHPLTTNKGAHYQGKPIQIRSTRLRMMSIKALCLHLGIGESTWQAYRKRDEYKDTVESIEAVIYTQKLEGAGADEFNANVVIRELGLKERTDITSGDESITEIRRRVIDSGADL